MAEFKLKLTTDTTQATTEIEKLGVAVADLGQESKKTTDTQKKGFKEAATEADNFQKKISDSKPTVNITKQTSEIQKLKKEIKDLTSAAIQAGEGTKKYAQALQEAANKTAELKDLQQAISSLDPDTKLQAIIGVAGGVAGAFAAAQGALALFGEESEDVQKALLKVQAALALAQGIQAVQGLADNFKILAVQVRNSAAAQRVFNLVANANPYVLVASGIAAAIGAFVLFTDSTEDNTDALIENDEIIKNSNKSREDLLKTLNDLAIAYQKEAGVLNDSEAQVFKLLNTQNEKKIELQKKLIEKKKQLDEEYAADLKRARIDDDKEEVERLQEQKEIRLQLIQQALQKEFDAEKAAIDIKIQTIEKAQTNADKKAADERIKMANAEAKRKKEADAKAIRDGIEFIKKQNENSDQELLDSQKLLNEKKDDLEKEAGAKTIENIQNVLDAEKQAKEDADKADAERAESLMQQQLERIKKQEAIASQFGDALGVLVAGQIDGNQKMMEQASKQILLLTIDTIEKSVLANVVAAQTNATVGSLASAQSIATGGIAGIAQSALLVGLITAAFTSFKALLTNALGFEKGGYTGDGDKSEYAGVVHKGEFVMTKEKTKKNRRLLDAIHNDNYTGLKPSDLSRLLEGTGVGLIEDLPKKMQTTIIKRDEIKQSERTKELKELRAIRDEIKILVGLNKDKIEGKKIRKGNTIRRLK